MNCPYCNRKLIKVFHGPPGDELGEESVKNTVSLLRFGERVTRYFKDIF